MTNESPQTPDDVLRELGIEPIFADDSLSPPPDKNRLRQLRDGQLNGNSRVEVIDCVAAFRPWYEAFLEVLLEPTESGESDA